ncbi:MAG: LysM domain-containing protein [Rhodocyclaceae bacterium]|nr:LysM domain-containing protein [Rhodocyclaceae bacterium]
MRHIIFALLLAFSSAAAFAKPIELAPDAPDRHIVVPGDTLWGIAAKFLKDPYRWPALWKMNAEQVKNPHRIYPGQVVILDRSGAEPQLRLGNVIKLEPQVRVEMTVKEIPAIPAQAIEPFLAQPLVIDAAAFENAPRVVATQESRVYAATGDMIYATGVDPNIRLWQVYRPGKPLIDPDNGEALGLEAIYLGNARPAGDGEPMPLTLSGVKQEIGRGDYLVAASRPEVMSYVPRMPEQAISGRVLALYGRVGEGGRNSIVSISRGTRDGLEMGHVLALYRAGVTVSNRFEDDKPKSHTLPDERYGLLFIFRVFDRVAYGLVTDAARPVMAGDRVRQP